MKKLIAVIIAFLVLPACVPKAWVKEGSRPNEKEEAEYACTLNSQKTEEAGPLKRMQTETDSGLFKLCMKAKGFRYVELKPEGVK